MRAARAALPLLLVALMAAPSWLGVASAQVAPPLPGLPTPNLPVQPPGPPDQADPLLQLLSDLQSFLTQAGQLGQQLTDEGPEGTRLPNADAIADRANGTLVEGQADLATADDAVIRPLFYEGFENGRTLGSLGWTQEVVRGSAPWGIVDSVNKTVVRGDGAVFTPEFESGESPISVKDGRHAATILNPQGRYDARVDARLISPVIDLRYVVGAGQRTDDPYDVATQDQRLGEPYRTFMGFWRSSLAGISFAQPSLHPMTLGRAYTWVFVTPPSQVQRIFQPNLITDARVNCPTLAAPELAGEEVEVPTPPFVPCGAAGESFFLNPLAERYGAGMVNLTFHHKYELAPQKISDPEYPQFSNLNHDGVFLEARVVRPDGTTGPWEHLLGDSVFEPILNRNTAVPSVQPSDGFVGLDVQPGPASGALPWPSGVVQQGLGPVQGGSDYDPVASRYNGRVLLQPIKSCFGTSTDQTRNQVADCQPDAPAFVERSAGRWKSHFTLNRFIGQQVQLAWRVHGGNPSTNAEDSGWFVDAIKVEALLHQRDPGVAAITRPRDGDLVATTQLVQPEAVVKNYGSRPVDGIRINFTVLEDIPLATPEELAANASADADAVGRSAGQLEVPGVPRTTLGSAQEQVRTPNVLLRASAFVPSLGSLEEVLVKSPLPCTSCAPGRYKVRVDLTTAPLSGGEPGSLPTDRAEDGSRLNNAVEVRFQVRDVPDAAVRMDIPASSVLTDINEAKVVRLEVENTGNIELTGVVEVVAQLLDPATLLADQRQGRIPVGSLFITPGELPPGKRLTSYGSDANRVLGDVTWTPTNLPPGVYVLEATFQASPAPPEPVTAALNAFIRATPFPYFPGDGRGREDFEAHRQVPDGFDRIAPRSAGFENQGFELCRVVEGSGCNDLGITTRPFPLPKGAVSVNHTWNATASDGPLVELSVLSLLSGSTFGVDTATPRELDAGALNLTAAPATLRVPAVTIDLENGTVFVPPLMVDLPALELTGLPTPVTVPAQRVESPPQTLDLGASSPLTTPPIDLATPALAVDQNGVRLTVPPIEVRIGPMSIAFPLRANAGRVEANASITVNITIGEGEVVIPSIPNPAGGEPTPEVRVPIPAVRTQTVPLDLSTEEHGIAPSLFDLPRTEAVNVTTEPFRHDAEGAAVPLGSGLPVLAVVRFEDERVRVCLSSDESTCTVHRYDDLEKNLSNTEQGKHRSHLNDYYLTREVNLTGCPEPCVLSFWHKGGFAWQGSGAENVSFPGTLGGPMQVPGGIQTVSPDQSLENRSRGMVEIVALDQPGATVRQDVLPEKVPSLGGQQDLRGCALVEGLCEEPVPEGCVPPEDTGLQPPNEVGQLPLVGRRFVEVLSSDPTCARDLVDQPADDSVIEVEYRTEVPQWTHQVVPLQNFTEVGVTKVGITFHFQTTVFRQQVNGTVQGCQQFGLACDGEPLDHWTLDNVRLGTRSSGGAIAPWSDGFYDPVGDPVENEEWTNWTRFRTLRDVADGNARLDPSCLQGLGRPLPSVPEPPGRGCTSSEFTGPVVAVEGRGWNVFAHGPGNVQPNGFENPFYDGWFLDETAGFQPAGREDLSRAWALRYGGPGTGGTYPPYSLYSLVSSRLLDLSQAASPFVDFQVNHTFSRTLANVDDPNSGVRDAGTVFLARYKPQCPLVGECSLVLDRRVLALPEGGYPGFANGVMEGLGSIDTWKVNETRGARLNNAFVGQSGPGGAVSSYVPVRIDLLKGLERLCLKAIGDGGGQEELHTFPIVYNVDAKVYECEGTAGVEWGSNGVGLHRSTGLTYRNITSFDLDPDARYALEFHVQNYEPVAPNTMAYGMAIDDLRLGERFLANDVGVSRMTFPRPGQVVGPGEAIQVRVNVTNHGLFTQRGIRLNFNVTQQGVQVFPDPTNASLNPPGCSLAACSQVTPLGLGIPGLRDTNPNRNVSLAFEMPWTPVSQGLFHVNTWTDILGEFVGGELIPLADENPVNDFFRQPVEVREVHSVRVLPSLDHPDESVVTPLVGTAQDRRALRVLVENLGTVSEGKGVVDQVDDDGDGLPDRAVPRALRVVLEITDEAGRALPLQPQPVDIDLVAPGKTIEAPFVWQPPSGGLFTLRFRAESALDLLPGDNERVVKVLVLSQLLPRPGEPWPEVFSAEGAGWANDTRFHFDRGEGWSFGLGDTYGPFQDGALLLDFPADLTNFRNAVVTLKHAYVFEQGYDGGVVEISGDGRNWSAVAPLLTTDEEGQVLYQGYPGALTTASPEVARPGDAVGAFTGDSGGVVTSVIPLGTVNLTRTEPVTLLRDTFDPVAGLGGADFQELRGQWVQVVTSSPPPAGKAWSADKALVWGPFTHPQNFQPDFAEVTEPAVTLEGHKALLAVFEDPATGLPRDIPAIDAPLVVEYDEWRALGLSKRGSDSIQSGFLVPNGVEVALERLDEDNASKVVLTVPVLPRGATPLDPYDDNYLDWTRRSIILPSSQTKQLLDHPARLAFRIYLANSNNEAERDPRTPVNLAQGTGKAGDTDFVSPHLGWAIASPSVYFITTPDRCEAAKLSFRDGRCIVFEDRLAYEDTDEALADVPRVGETPPRSSPWTGAFRTERHVQGLAPQVSETPSPDPRYLNQGGWRLLDAVGFATPRDVWDAEAQAPPRSGRGGVAEATGMGVEARLVAPLNLRNAASATVLRLNHSFKLTDLRISETTPALTIHGALSGGRVEVSRDGGQTWEPLAPIVPTRTLADGSLDKLNYTKSIEALGLLPVFARGNPLTEQLCQRPTHLGCLTPETLFDAPGGWLADGADNQWTPLEAASAHTPFGGGQRDPERDSPFGLGSRAFSGTTCEWPTQGDAQGNERPLVRAERIDPCGGPEDWRTVAFDLSPYEGQEVLLGFHAFFTTHRFAGAEHVGCSTFLTGSDPCSFFGSTSSAYRGEWDDELLLPADFWRIDDVTVESRVLDGKPVFLRLRGFSDPNGERYGWDVLNVSILGDRHLRNLGARILGPEPGAPLFGTEAIDARLVNRGQEPLKAVGSVLVEQLGAVSLRDGGFEVFERPEVDDQPGPARFVHWNVTAPGGSVDATDGAAEGDAALVASATGASDKPFRVQQTVRVPPGHWRLVGLAGLDPTAAGGAGIVLQGAVGDDGRANPAVRFANNGTYQRFALNFTVEGAATAVTFAILADASRFGANLAGTVKVDHLRVEPRPPPEAVPESAGLVNGGFEQWLEGWDLLAGSARASGVSDRWNILFPTQTYGNGTFQNDTQGEGEVAFELPITRLNVTSVNLTINVTTEGRLLPENMTVNVTAANGTREQRVYPIGPGTASPGSKEIIIPVDGLPRELTVNGTSREEALRDPAIPPSTNGAVGTWRIQVGFTVDYSGVPAPLRPTTDPLNLQNYLHSEGHQVRMDASVAAYTATAHGVPAEGVEVVPEGSRTLTVTGLGLGPDDLHLAQAVALGPGKHRLSGLLATQDATLLLTKPEESDDPDFRHTIGIVNLTQELRAADLPRSVTEVLVWTAAPGSTIEAKLYDVTDPGTRLLLGSGSGTSVDAGIDGATRVPLRAVIPYGVEALHLDLDSASTVSVQLRPGDEYANGSIVAPSNHVDKDVRLAFVGAIDPGRGIAESWVAGWVSTAPASQPSDRRADLALPASVEYPLRMGIDLDGLPARRITNVTFDAWLPSRPGQVTLDLESEPPDDFVHYAILEGRIKAMLFDEQGRALSDEADYCACLMMRAGPFFSNTSSVSIDATLSRIRINFTHAIVPAGVDQVFLGLRAVNFTDGEVRLRAAALRNSSENAEPPGNLTWKGQTFWARTGCVLNLTEDSSSPRHGCDLPLNLTFRREGRVTIAAEGAEGDPLVLAQPTNQTSVLAAQTGGVPFAYDFVVPPGAGPVTLRIRADQFQGDLVLDDLHLGPLTPPAVGFGTDLAPGGEARIVDADGEAPRIVGAKGAAYAITARAVAVDGEGRPVGELLLGDNRATLRTGPILGPGRLVVTRVIGAPNSINLSTGQPASVLVTLRNEGAEEVDALTVDGAVQRRNGEVVVSFSQADFDPIPDDLTFAPLEERTLRWPLPLDPTLAHGVYLATAVVGTQPRGDFLPADSAAESLLYIGSDFHRQFGFEWPFGNATTEDELLEWLQDSESMRNTERWTSSAHWNPALPRNNACDPAPNPIPDPNNNPCAASANGTAEEITEFLNWMWRKTDELNLSAFRSITLGGDPAFTPVFVPCCQGLQSADGTVFATVRSPAIAIRDMQRPQLGYADRHDFQGLEPEGAIYARLLDAGERADRADWVPFPAGKCLDENGAPAWVRVDEHIQGLSPGFRSDKWNLRSVDLGPLMDAAAEAAAEVGDDVGRWDHVQVCWQLDQPSPRNGPALIKEWSIDDVMVTPYGMALGPAQRIPITDNVTKDFRLLLRNRGAYTDTYQVRLEEETGLATRGPANWRIALFDEEGRPLDEVQVQPGTERTVVLRVRVDVAPPTLAREGTIDLAITAISTTTSMLRSTQHLLFDFTYEDRPNLRVVGLIVNDATLSVDKPRTVDVLVQNTGTVAARGAALAVVDKMDAAFGVPPETLRLLDGSPVPVFDLAPGDTKVVTVNWIPRVDGEHNVTAIADPGGRILEFDERDNTLVKPIVVPKAEFPDLLVEASASQANPSPGDLVEVSVRITNKGGAAADGVQLSLRAGVTDLLPGEPPHVLPQSIFPGQTVVMNASWRPAFPGEQTIIVRARTFAGVLERLETSGDNVVLLTIRVRSRGLDIGVPADVAVRPGEVANATIEVRNRGDVDDTYIIRLQPPDDWRAAFASGGEEVRVSVGNHSALNLSLQLGPPRHAEAGPVQVLIHARSENGTEALQASLVASVPQHFGIRFTLEPEHLVLPGKRYLPLTLQNGGNGLDFVTVRARSLPAGWSVEPTTFAVGPRSSVDVRVNLTSPTTTPEGAYALVLEAQGRGGDLLAQDAHVQVLPYELLGLRIEGLPEVLQPGGAVEGRLVVTNDGNLPARAALSVSAAPDWRVRLERDVVAMVPGEARFLALGVVVPANASSRAVPFIASAVSGTGAAYRETLALRPARADLAVLGVEQQPRGQVRDGATMTLVAVVANQGEIPMPSPIAVYVDDALLGYQEGPLIPPGGEARIELTFKAKGGEHVILVVVDPAQLLGEEDETDNAHLLVQRVDRAAGLFAVPGLDVGWLVLAAAGVALILRKRKAVDR